MDHRGQVDTRRPARSPCDGPVAWGRRPRSIWGRPGVHRVTRLKEDSRGGPESRGRGWVGAGRGVGPGAGVTLAVSGHGPGCPSPRGRASSTPSVSAFLCVPTSPHPVRVPLCSRLMCACRPVCANPEQGLGLQTPPGSYVAAMSTSVGSRPLEENWSQPGASMGTPQVLPTTASPCLGS